MDNNNFENVTNAAEEVVAQAAEPVVEAAETVAQAAEPVVEAATTAAGAEAGSMPVYTDYSSYDNGEKKGINVLGLVAMILGILSIVLLICGCCLSAGSVVTAIFKYLLIFIRIGMAIAAIILGAVGMKKRPDQKGMAIAGLILGIFGVLLGLLSLIFAIIGSVAGAAISGVSNSAGFQQYLEELQDSLENYNY